MSPASAGAIAAGCRVWDCSARAAHILVRTHASTRSSRFQTAVRCLDQHRRSASGLLREQGAGAAVLRKVKKETPLPRRLPAVEAAEAVRLAAQRILPAPAAST